MRLLYTLYYLLTGAGVVEALESLDKDGDVVVSVLDTSSAESKMEMG